MDKKSRIEIETFMDQYRPAVEANMDRGDFAKSIGVQTATVYQRIYELNRRGLEIPQLALRRTEPLVDRARAAWKPAGKPAPKADVKHEPKVKAEAKAKETAAIVKAATKPKESPVVSDAMDELNKLLGG